MKKTVILILAIIAFSVTAYHVYQQITDPYSKEILINIEYEYSLIQKQPEDILIYDFPSRQPVIVGYVASFKSHKTYNECRAYYDVELKRNGWYFKNDDIDNGDIVARYGKGDYTLSMDYAGDANSEWTYSFDFMWEK